MIDASVIEALGVILWFALVGPGDVPRRPYEPPRAEWFEMGNPKPGLPSNKRRNRRAR